MAQVAAELQSVVAGIQAHLKDFTYPFPHARGRLSVAEYARFEKPDENDWIRAYQDADVHVDRLFALHFQLVGRILVRTHAAENSLEPDRHLSSTS